MGKEGRLELLVGNMFGGKSTELIRRINRYEVLRKRVTLFKHSFDQRYGTEEVCSHDGLKREAILVNTAQDLEKFLPPETEVVGIEEVQFFDGGIVPLCYALSKLGRTVLAAGLLKDFRGELFPFSDGKRNIGDLISMADKIDQFNAYCTYENGQGICGRDAAWIQRFYDGQVAPYDSPTIFPGGKEAYAPRCREHFVFYPENRHLRL